MLDHPCFNLVPVVTASSGCILLECTYDESSWCLGNERLSQVAVSKVRFSKVAIKLSSIIQLFYFWDRIFLASQCPYLLKIENDDNGRFLLSSYFVDCNFSYTLKTYVVGLGVNDDYTPTVAPMGIF